MDLTPDLGTVLIRDCLEVDGAFLIVQLMKLALSGAPDLPPRRVVLLAAQHAASHYALVLRKAGLHMPVLLEAGQLAVVDLLTSSAGSLPNLAQLHQQLAAAAHSSVGGSVAGIVLIADDLTVLRTLAGGSDDWEAFLHYCTALGQDPGCTFIGLAHGDVEADEGWLCQLEHAASLVLDVEPLESGRSTDTTGRLAVTRRDAGIWAAAAAGPAAPGTRVYSFKLADSGASYVEQVVV